MRKLFVILILIFASLLIYEYSQATDCFYDIKKETCFCETKGFFDKYVTYIPCNKIPEKDFYTRDSWLIYRKATSEEYNKYKDK